MLIKTNGKEASLAFATWVPVEAKDFEVKAFTDKAGVTETKTAPDGSDRVQYRTQLDCLKVDPATGKIERTEKNATISVLKPVELEMAVIYEPVGAVWVTHYVTDQGRLGVSIVVETLAPKSANSKSSLSSANSSSGG